MGRGWMTGAMLAIAALPVSASAQTDAFADCAADRADAGLKRSLAAALINGADDSVVDPLMAQYAAISNACTADWALDDAQRKAYLDYGVMRLMRDWLASELAGYGLSAATVDEALDFGPGRGNTPLAGGMREDEVKELVQAFIEAGIDAENLSAPAWEAVGTYAAVSPIFWRKRQQVSAWTLVPKHAAPPPAPVAASVAPAAEPVPISQPDTAPVEPVLPEPVPPVAADTSTMSAEPLSVPISDPVVEPVAVPIEAAAPEEEPAAAAPEPASPAAATPAPQESAPMPAETATPEAPAPEVPDTPAPAEPAPDAASAEPPVAPAPVSASEAAPAEAAAAPAEPVAPVILPYEPLPDAVDPVLPGGEAPASAEVPPAEPPPGA